VAVDDVSVDEFKSFRHTYSSSYELKEVWVEAIKLSRMWHLHRPRNIAVAKLEEMKLEPATQVELARKCGIEAWLCPAMLKLALQQSPPPESTAKQLGFDYTMFLLQLREEIIPERQYVLYSLLLRDIEETRQDPRNMKCRFCGTHVTPDVGTHDLSEKEIVAMVRELVADEFSGQGKLEDTDRDNTKARVSRKHLTRRAAVLTPLGTRAPVEAVTEDVKKEVPKEYPIEKGAPMKRGSMMKLSG